MDMRFQPYSARIRVMVFVLVTVVLAVSHRASADANTIAVDSLTIAANQMSLKGEFGLGATKVLLGSNELPVVSGSPGQVVATLNPIAPIGTYRVTLIVGNKPATVFAAISPNCLHGLVGADGSVAGTGFAASHPYAGTYHVTFPPGTFQIGAPYVFPPVLVTPLFAGAPAVPNVTAYVYQRRSVRRLRSG